MNKNNVNEIATIRQSQTRKICFEVQATALRPDLYHYEEFHYPLTDLSQRDFRTRNYNTSEYTTPQLNPLHKR